MFGNVGSLTSRPALALLGGPVEQQLKRSDLCHPEVATSPLSFLSSEYLAQATGSVLEKVQDTPFPSELHTYGLMNCVAQVWCWRPEMQLLAIQHEPKRTCPKDFLSQPYKATP